jgi:hypothetical protein
VVEEAEDIPNGYEMSQAGLVITNAYTGGEKVKVEATKTWSGIPEGGPYPSTKITLKQNGDTYKAPVELTATGNGDQPAEWADLPKYAPDGEAYVYTVVEEAEDIPNGYEMSQEGLVITNTYTGGEKVEVEATKEWKGIPATATVYPEATITLYQNDVVYGDAIKLISIGNGKQDAKWKDLPKYAPDSSEYIYTVKETSVPNGYAMTQDGFTITNTYDGITDNTDPENPEETPVDVTVKKVWLDEDGKPITGNLPAKLAIKVTGGEADLTADLTAAGTWTHTFKELKKFGTDGEAFVYEASETVPNGYTLTSTVEDPDYTFTLTNTYDGITDNTDPENPEETPVDVTVKKVWLDEDDKPITENLPAKLAIKVTGGEADLTADLTAAGTWTHTFKELKKFGTDGEAFVYEASETVPNGYTLTSTVEAPDYTFTLTNTYDGITDNTDPENPEETPVDVTVKKVWLDEDDKPITGNLPAKLAIKVTGGEADLTADLTAAGTWTHTFKELKKFGTDGEAFVYEASETVPNGYTLTSTVEDPDYTFTLTNTYDGITDNTDPENPEETPVDVTVKKVWLDEDDKPITGNLPAKLAIKVTGGEADLTADLTAEAGTWTHTFKELKKFGTDGEAFVYEASETVRPGERLHPDLYG